MDHALYILNHFPNVSCFYSVLYFTYSQIYVKLTIYLRVVGSFWNDCVYIYIYIYISASSRLLFFAFSYLYNKKSKSMCDTKISA